MAEKRMFSKEIIDSDAFLDMPSSTQNLYFHLGMRADDDGFINSPNKIMTICKSAKNDMDLLIAKNFVIPFENGILVIKHWRLNNYLRSDRYKPTNYQEELSQLNVKDNGVYQLKSDVGIPMVDQRYTQNREDKISIEEIKEEEKGVPALPSPETPKTKTKVKAKIDSYILDLLNQSDIAEDVKNSLNGWIEYKYSRNEKYVEKGFMSLLSIVKKKCSIYGNTAVINLIEECQSNLWQGIIWDKLSKRGGGVINNAKPTKTANPDKYIREE